MKVTCPPEALGYFAAGQGFEAIPHPSFFFFLPLARLAHPVQHEQMLGHPRKDWEPSSLPTVLTVSATEDSLLQAAFPLPCEQKDCTLLGR